MIKLRWICIDLTSNDKKCWVTSQTIQNAKLQKWSKYNDFQRFDVKNFKTTQNCKSNEITMNCIDITSKWSKMLLCRKTFETTENYKSDQIGRQNEQNDELCRKTFKTTQNYESDQIIMNCIDLTSKRSKMLSYVANHSKQTTKVIKIQWLSTIWCQKLQNNAKQKMIESDQITMNLHRFDVKTIKNVELRRKPFKTTLNYKSDQNTMTFNDLMSKTSKQRKTTKVIKLQWIASI